MKDFKKYNELLKYSRWINYRAKIIERDHKQCRCCGINKTLQVHHRQYHFNKKTNDFVKPWDYHPKLLITFCENCHKAGEKAYGKVPVKYI